MDLAIFSHQRKGDNRGAGRDLSAAARPVLDHFADELVTEDDVLFRPHKPVVSRLDHDIGQLVAGPAGMEVGTADPAPEHP